MIVVNLDLEDEECGLHRRKCRHSRTWTINRLLELPDALELFGSLQVGVPLDIGCCHEFPFAKELVRIYNAQYIIGRVRQLSRCCPRSRVPSNFPIKVCVIATLRQRAPVRMFIGLLRFGYVHL
jgi:hypothetical protein